MGELFQEVNHRLLTSLIRPLISIFPFGVKMCIRDSSSDLFTELKVFRGTVVTSGEAVMEATQIGDNTVLGSINTSLQEDSKDSPSKEKLNKLAGNIGVLGYSAGAAYSVINLVLGFIALNKANNLNGCLLYTSGKKSTQISSVKNIRIHKYYPFKVFFNEPLKVISLKKIAQLL